MNIKPSQLYEVRRSSIHRKGLFAARRIHKGTRIIEYVGERITKREAERRGNARLNTAKKNGAGAVYIFELNRRFDIDGDVPENIARHINHSCDPNCLSENIRGHIWVVALRNILPGEELSYDYGYDVENYADHPCRCGSKNCLGYIVAEDQRKDLKKRLAEGHRGNRKRKSFV